MADLQVYTENGANRFLLTIDEQTSLDKALMGSDVITCAITTITKQSNLQAIIPGDYVVFDNEKYYLNRPPQIEKLKSNLYRYTFAFEGEVYRLLDKTFRQPVTGDSDFYLVDNLDGILSVLLTNINSAFPGWTKGSVVYTDRALISFDGDSCRNVLNKLANEFEVEFYLVGKQINFVGKYEVSTPHVFSVDKNSGLYELKRLNVDSENTVTRAFLYGGTKNIPATYRNGSKRLVYESSTGNRYIEDYSQFNRLVEKNVVFEDVFPRFAGVVNSTTVSNGIRKIINCNIDFHINNHLVSGVEAKVYFRTGDLTGKEFAISAATHNTANNTGTITLIPYSDDGGVSYPNTTMYPRATDEFTLYDMDMPQSYVTNAENELLAKGQEWLNIYAQLRVKYELKFDNRYLRDSGISLEIGDVVRIVDASLNIDQQIRVTKLKINVSDVNDVTAEISNIIREEWQDNLEAKIQQTIDKVNIQASSNVFDINATKDWVGRNFAQLNSENTFLSLQKLNGGLETSYLIIDPVVTGNPFAILQNSNGQLLLNSQMMWNEGNDGAGSGLDADLLDGYQSNSFPRKAENAVITGNWIFLNKLYIGNKNVTTAYNKNICWNGDDDGYRIGHTGEAWTSPNYAQLKIDWETGIIINGGGIGYGKSGVMITSNVAIGKESKPLEALDVAGNQLLTGNIRNNLFNNTSFNGQGWRLDSNDDEGKSHLVLDRLTVRGRMDIYELVINQIRATNGSLWVSDAMKVTTAQRDVGWANQYIQFNFDNDNGSRGCTFVVGDVVKAQRFTGRNVQLIKGRVYNIGATYFRIDTNGHIDNYTGSLDNLAGLEFVRVNSTIADRKGALYLTSSDSGSPFMDVIYDEVSRLRVGKLTGVGTQTGYGIWGSQNGVDTNFVISSDGYAKIAGWNFNDTTLNKIVNDNNVWIGTDPLTNSHTGFGVTKNGGNFIRMVNGGDSNSYFQGFKDGNIIFQLDTVNSSQIAGIKFDNEKLYTSKWFINKDGSFSFADGKITGATNGSLVAGSFTVDNDSIFSGTKQTNNSYTTNGVTLHSSGAIRTPEFRVDTDGKAYFKGNLAAPTGTLGGFILGQTSLITDGTELLSGYTSKSGIKFKSNAINGVSAGIQFTNLDNNSDEISRGSIYSKFDGLKSLLTVSGYGSSRLLLEGSTVIEKRGTNVSPTPLIALKYNDFFVITEVAYSSTIFTVYLPDVDEDGGSIGNGKEIKIICASNYLRLAHSNIADVASGEGGYIRLIKGVHYTFIFYNSKWYPDKKITFST